MRHGTLIFLQSVFLFFLVIEETFAIKPDSIYYNNPSNFNLGYSEIQVCTKDNKAINIWDIKVNNPKAIIILCNGDAGNMSYNLLLTYYLTQQNFKVILFDYRGYGKSETVKLDTSSLYYSEFQLDYEAVYDYTKLMYPEERIGVLGLSMGGYFPLISSKPIDFYLGDSPLISIYNTMLRIGYDDLSLISEKLLLSRSISMLVFIGFNDKVIKIDDFYALKKVCPNSTLLLYNGDHAEGFFILKETYIDLINSFISNAEKK